MTTDRVNASATKGFFVDMLVRDISIDGAIFDLIDNAVDAAFRVQDFSGFHIDLEIKPEHFTISDNCGGIDLDTARNYAFRFGRAANFNPQTPIGRFGIGMKRAVFRLGTRFKVESSTTASRFVVDVDVKQWCAEEHNWTFPMEVEGPGQEAGTKVEVSELHDSVSALFSSYGYDKKMLRGIAAKHEQALSKNLSITLNGQPADSLQRKVLVSDRIQPEHQKIQLESRGHQVELTIAAGISPDSHAPVDESGWYVYCNGRLVLEADRTEVTGWGTGDPGEASLVPAWHPQYARFRGFVFFRSDDPEALPWTTTKAEIDESAEVYRNALGRMRPVIRRFANFTNTLAQEHARFEEGSGTDSQPIKDAVESASAGAVADCTNG